MGCAEVKHLRFTNSRFCVFHVKMNHFEVHLMVSSRVVGSKVLRMARCFLFGMSPDVLTFKVVIFTSDFKF